MKKCLILATVTALLMSGCANTQTKPNNDTVIPYENDKSLAWNVMNQVEAADKLHDVEAPERSAVSDTSAAGHIIFGAMSWNFIGGLTTSLLLDNKYPIDRNNLIMAVDLRGAEGGDIGIEMAKLIKEAAIKKNPKGIFSNIEPYIDGYKFTEQSEECSELLDLYVDKNPDRSTFKRYKEAGICNIFMRGVEIIGPANSNLFPNAENLTTVRLTFDLHRWATHFIKYLPDAYLFHKATNKTQAFVEHKNKAYLFVKKSISNGDEYSLPIESTPNFEGSKKYR
jgi:hypothetical protein